MITNFKIHADRMTANKFIQENAYLGEILTQVSGWDFGDEYTEANFETGDDNILPFVKELSKGYPSLKIELRYKHPGIYDIDIVSVVTNGSNEDFIYCL